MAKTEIGLGIAGLRRKQGSVDPVRVVSWSSLDQMGSSKKQSGFPQKILWKKVEVSMGGV